MIKLGSKVKDSITGFSGIATSRVEFMYGCNRIQIEPDELNKEGKPIEGQYFDEQRVELILEDKPKVSKESTARSGGDYPPPSLNKDP
jgi:hypothetical protein